ncbi:MAG: hypothetical protein WDM70_11180 [Nitrosomonadales bacterium]
MEDQGAGQRLYGNGLRFISGLSFCAPGKCFPEKRSDPSKLVLIRLLTMLMNDASNNEIEGAFKEHADLTYNLMRIREFGGPPA